MKKNDWILIVGILVCSLAAYAGLSIYQKCTAELGVAVVTVDGEMYAKYSLDDEITEKIELADGSYNVLQIQEGQVDITEASCPDKICVDHRPVRRNGQSIVCLPNKVVVEIVGAQESEVDSFTN